MSLYCFIAKTAVIGRPKKSESQKAGREDTHSLETAWSGAGGIGSSGGKVFCVCNAVVLHVVLFLITSALQHTHCINLHILKFRVHNQS